MDPPMKRLLLTGVMAAFACMPALAEPLTLAVVAPKSGLFDVLGEQVRQGAHLAADRLSISLVDIEESCTVGSGPAIAEEIRKAGAKAAIGFLCSESLVGGLQPLAEAGIPAITLSVRWKGLMEDAGKEGWPFFPPESRWALMKSSSRARLWHCAAFFSGTISAMLRHRYASPAENVSMPAVKRESSSDRHTDATPRRLGFSHHLRRASASACSAAAIDTSSRWTASSS